ncbi:hypothetical protein GUJ93_ZPchr0337g7086 [Zizania palustris]|uniref:Uncharacterized protein n=1 Tax=Zizania palustris TaxID=103762 RepID=A0A8J5QTN1_ZIZPA|nr:hypothetical protein GUJ93_ZPchr0337g7086 [Zizania palustris]
MILEASQSSLVLVTSATQVLEIPATPVVATSLPPPVETEDFQGWLEDLLAELSSTLPQALLPTPPKKVAALFKKPLSPRAIRAIREAISGGGGQDWFARSSAPSTSTPVDLGMEA